MSDEFPFEEGDRVLVRVREHGGTNGRIRAKFLAECKGFERGLLGDMDRVELLPAWGEGPMDTLRLKPYDAEFETVAADEEVSF